MKVQSLVLAATIAVITGACSAPPPPTPVEAARAKARAIEENRQADDIIDSVTARPVPCGPAAKRAFRASDGEPTVFFYRDATTTLLECYNSAGNHRIKRAPLQAVTQAEVDEIISRPDLYPPTPQVIVVQQPVVIRRPAPIVITQQPVIIDEQPCCRL